LPMCPHACPRRLYHTPFAAHTLATFWSYIACGCTVSMSSRCRVAGRSSKCATIHVKTSVCAAMPAAFHFAAALFALFARAVLWCGPYTGAQGRAHAANIDTTEDTDRHCAYTQQRQPGRAGVFWSYSTHTLPYTNARQEAGVVL